MEIHIRVRPFEHSVLEPLGLPDAKHVAGRLEVGHVRRLVGGILDLEHDVDDRLGGEGRHGCRARVLQPHDLLAERRADAHLLPLVQGGPAWVVVDDLDWRRERLGLADHNLGQRLVVGRDVVRIACGTPSFHDHLPHDLAA